VDSQKADTARGMRAIGYPPARLTRARFLVPLLLSSALTLPAYADVKFQQEHIFPKARMKEAPLTSSKTPVLLIADQMHYDQPNNVVTASGHVEIDQGDTILLADKITYNQNTNIVRAIGHVSVLEPNGNVYFADQTELTDDMRAGVVEQFKARLIDDSHFVAAGAYKIDENHTELFNAAYTPCNCELDGKPKTPMWQITADHAMIDQQDQEIRYKNVFFNFYDVPVVYSPYFSHSTPGADNQSGLLMPSLLQSSNLGTEYRQPIYYAIAPNKDVTITPIYTSKAGPVIVGEYRQMFDAGPLLLDGSFTSAPNTNAAGNPAPGRENRGHYDIRGNFIINDNYDWGLDVHRSTDDTYLHLYNFGSETLLTSRVYAEGFNFVGDSDRNYASIQGLAFQDQTGQANPKLVPVVAPLTDFTYQSQPGIYNSRVLLDANAMSLYRISGDESRRLSGTAGWKLPYISSDGQVIEFTATVRSDIYDVSNVDVGQGRHFNGVTGRELPQASLLWHYPFVNRLSANSSVMIEPVFEIDASTGGGNAIKIPNEDSGVPEFNDANLFSPNRFAGLDRVENGGGMSYGVRGQAQFDDKYIDWLLGEHYRLYSDTSFPFSEDPNSRFSDYVGNIGITYHPITLAYRFRFDKDTLAANRSEIDAGYNLYPVGVNFSYLSLHDDPVLATKEIITGNTSLNLTRQWSWVVNGSRDLHLNETDTLYTGLNFKNECVNLTTMVGKDYTNLLDIKPSLTFWFKISLKNLE
jgi:LPS-assembly protein